MSGWDDVARRAPAKPKDDLATAADLVTRLTQNVAQMKKLVADMGTLKDTTHLRTRLRQAREANTRLAKEAMTILQRKQQSPMESRDKARFQKILETHQAAIKELSSVEKLYAANEKSMPAPLEAVVVDNPMRSPSYKQGMMGATAESDVQLEFAAQQKVQETRNTIQTENAQELRAAAADLQMLQSMALDVAQMVNQQGEMVNEMVSNIDTAAGNVEDGTDELRKAREYQAAYRKKCCICWTIVFILVAVIIIAIAVPLAKK